MELALSDEMLSWISLGAMVMNPEQIVWIRTGTSLLDCSLINNTSSLER